jgi:hypothetical protein
MTTKPVEPYQDKAPLSDSASPFRYIALNHDFPAALSASSSPDCSGA